jgi:hypothetical protein
MIKPNTVYGFHGRFIRFNSYWMYYRYETIGGSYTKPQKIETKTQAIKLFFTGEN